MYLEPAVDFGLITHLMQKTDLGLGLTVKNAGVFFEDC